MTEMSWPWIEPLTSSSPDGTRYYKAAVASIWVSSVIMWVMENLTFRASHDKRDFTIVTEFLNADAQPLNGSRDGALWSFFWFHIWCVWTGKALVKLHGFISLPEPFTASQCHQLTFFTWAGWFKHLGTMMWYVFKHLCYEICNT